jgi:hypothetical protein
MADEKLVACLKKGAGAWNEWRATNANIRADLSGAYLIAGMLYRADLSEANLSGANLSAADLSEANLSGANLSGAKPIVASLRGANLIGTDLSGAHLIGADLSDAHLRGAYLIGADLSLAKLFQADLAETNFEGATIDRTVFANVDLSAAKGLDRVRHVGPSSLGIDTVLRSGGKIPPEFLRGCGFDPLIQEVLIGSPASKTEAFTLWLSKSHKPFQRCFISYATEDKPFVDRLQKALNETGVDYWYAPEHGRWGEELHTQIDREISLRDRMLLVCSETSLAKDWVIYEIERAIDKEKTCGRRVIFPILLDDALLKWNHPRATRIRDVLAADFRRATKGEAFEEKFQKLQAALRAEGVSQPA